MPATMYPAIINSPVTTLASGINSSITTIHVVDGSLLPDAPNLATIGADREAAETILYATKIGNTLSDVTRGFQGDSEAWPIGSPIGRMFTAYDHDAFRTNIIDIELTPGPAGPKGEDAYRVEIISSNGKIFKNGVIETILSARVYRGGEDITDQINASYFKWERVSEDAVGDAEWNLANFGGKKQVHIFSADVPRRATFNCSLLNYT